MITLYHNPRCDISRKALALLQGEDREIVVIDYFSDPINETTVLDIARKIGVSPKDLIRKVEPKYQKEFKGKDFSDDDWARIIVKNLELLERPILISAKKSIIAKPPELVLELL
ncbi:MAG: arsenate reductase [Sphingobacteriales bacterium]|jgi:arsenate reductase